MEQTIAAGKLKRLGRFDSENPGRLGWAMSGVELMVRCTEMSVEIDCDYGDQCPWMGVLVDDAPVARFALRRGRHRYVALAGLDEGTARRIAIVRDTQPIPGDERMRVEIVQVSFEGERLADEPRRLHMEFAGDSLTSGEGTVGAVGEEQWRSPFMSAMNTYAQILCAAFGAQGSWISQSGWGVCRSWDGQESCRIPAVYEQVCANDPAGGKAHDFTSHPADVVIVNLGTNDSTPMAALKGAARRAYREQFLKGAEDFLRQIRAHHSGAQILWCYGMCEKQLQREIAAAVEHRRADGDERVHFLLLPACREKEIGARMHPGVNYHRRAAELIAEKIRAIGIE